MSEPRLRQFSLGNPFSLEQTAISAGSNESKDNVCEENRELISAAHRREEKPDHDPIQPVKEQSDEPAEKDGPGLSKTGNCSCNNEPIDDRDCQMSQPNNSY